MFQLYKYQFTTRIKMEGETLPILDKTRLLGVVIPIDLKWRFWMEILRKLIPFHPPIEDMKTIYIYYILGVF